MLRARSAVALALALLLSACSARGTRVAIFDTSQTPVQLVKDASSGLWTFNVHLYVLVDAGSAEDVVQGGALWRFEGEQRWRPAPVPLYDEHQVDGNNSGSAVRGPGVRGYNIAWGQELGPDPENALNTTMEFRVWALARGDKVPAEAHAVAPVRLVDIGQPEAGPLEVSLFKAVAFTTGREDGVHAHLVLNIWPPQLPSGPDHQLFVDVLSPGGGWTGAGAPSRFEHTYDAPDPGSARRCSRYNLSWRLAPGLAPAEPCASRGGPSEAASLKLRVLARTFGGAEGSLHVPPVEVACASGGAGETRAPPDGGRGPRLNADAGGLVGLVVA